MEYEKICFQKIVETIIRGWLHNIKTCFSRLVITLIPLPVLRIFWQLTHCPEYPDDGRRSEVPEKRKPGLLFLVLKDREITP